MDNFTFFYAHINSRISAACGWLEGQDRASVHVSCLCFYATKIEALHCSSAYASKDPENLYSRAEQRGFQLMVWTFPRFVSSFKESYLLF